MGGKKKKKKVAPVDGGGEMSQEEKKVEAQARQVRKAQDYMTDRYRIKLVKTYPVGGGLLPWTIVQFLPTALTKTSPTLFGKPSEMNLKGVAAAAFRMMKLSSITVHKIKKVFQKIDFNDSGYITIGQLMDYTQGKDTLFIRGLLKQTLLAHGPTKMDSMLNFPEFFIVTVVLCTYSIDQILYIIFKMFDDNRDFIDTKKLNGMLKSLATSGGGFNGNAKAILAGFDQNGDDMLNFDEFVGLYRTNPVVFFPAFKLQEKLREATLTVSKWRSMSNVWDKKEKDRSVLLERDPIPFSEQLVEVSKWLENQRQKQKQRNSKHAAQFNKRKNSMVSSKSVQEERRNSNMASSKSIKEERRN